MRRSHRARLSVLSAVPLALAVAVCVAPAAPATSAPAGGWPDPASLRPAPAVHAQGVRIEVEYPEPGARIEDERPVMVSGWALPPGAALPRRDIAVVIDVSESTLEPFRTPGEIPERPAAVEGESAPPGSVLEAEIAAARRLLRTLDPRFSRVAVITFSGNPVEESTIRPEWRAFHPAARTWIGLSDDWEAVNRALDDVAEAGAHGLTHMAAGVERATAELVGGPGASAPPDPRAQRAILFMTDGIPTLPWPGDLWRNQAELFRQARRAAAYGIRIHGFAVGSEALRGPFTVATMAADTGGVYTPVRDAQTLPDKLPLVPLSGLERVGVRNLTTGDEALGVNLRADGTFDALVRLAPGPNRIAVEAVASDGERARRELLLERSDRRTARAPGAHPLPLPDHLVQRRGELLENTLDRQREAHRRELVEEMERERRAERERALREQRRELDLRLEGRHRGGNGALPAVGGAPPQP